MNAQLKEPWPLATPTDAPTPKVYAAIAKVMAAVGMSGISKDRKNEQQGYKFRGIDDVYNALSTHLAHAGLVLLPRVKSRAVTERLTQKGGVLFYVVLDMDFDIVCAEDGSRHTVSVSGEAMDSGDKATNKAMSAAFKYACMQVFCIPTEGNPDADQTTHEVAPPPVADIVWTALTDAAAHGEKQLRKVWSKGVPEETRNIITGAHNARWEQIKATAAAADKAKVAA
jgi:hypothetical protein